jgi:hypothetical protein
MFASYPLEQVRDSFRAAVLAALDEAAKQYTGNAASGWTDSDLPEFFRALDSQIERVAERHDIALLEEVTS